MPLLCKKKRFLDSRNGFSITAFEVVDSKCRNFHIRISGSNTAGRVSEKLNGNMRRVNCVNEIVEEHDSVSSFATR